MLGVDQLLAWGIVNTVAQCTDVSNFIFAIKQGGLGLALEVYTLTDMLYRIADF